MTDLRHRALQWINDHQQSTSLRVDLEDLEALLESVASEAAAKERARVVALMQDNAVMLNWGMACKHCGKHIGDVDASPLVRFLADVIDGKSKVIADDKEGT